MFFPLAVATIHQPSSDIFHLFDDLLILADGHVLYHGPCGDSFIQYFARQGYPCPQYSNPADFLFMSILNKQGGDESTPAADSAAVSKTVVSAAEIAAQKSDLADKERIARLLQVWTTSPEALDLQRLIDHPTVTPGVKLSAHFREPAPFATQFRLLAARAWYNQIRNPLILKASFGQTMFMSLLVGLIWLRIDNDQSTIQDRNGALFFMAANGTMTATIGVLSIFGLEKIVFTREFQAGLYGLPAYFAARVSGSLLLSLPPSFLPSFLLPPRSLLWLLRAACCVLLCFRTSWNFQLELSCP